MWQATHRWGYVWHETDKKAAPATNNGASCVLKVVYPYRVNSRHNRPSPRLIALTSSPPDFLFSSILSHHPPPKKNRNIPYWSCLLCTPSLTLPPSSLKCSQKSNPGIHIKCFRCFKCFGCFRCFISLLDHKTARFWSKSELNPQTDRNIPPPYNACGKHPKKRFTHL